MTVKRVGLHAAEDRARQVDGEACDVENKICHTRAETTAGLLVQARLLAKQLEDFGDDNDAALAANMLASINRLVSS